jgi:myo-inositol-1(or 4)-monophosphatase
MPASILMRTHLPADDEGIVEGFWRLLEGCGLNPVWAGDSVAEPEVAAAMMRRHELFGVVLAATISREELSAVDLEVQTALALQRKVLVFREQGLPVRTAYPEKLQMVWDVSGVKTTAPAGSEALSRQVLELLTLYGINTRIAPVDPELLRRYDFAREQAQSLGGAVLRYYNDVFYPNEIRNRASRNFPTSADIRANRMIISEIQKNQEFRDDAIISEEDTQDPVVLKEILQDSGSETGFTWVIDPLDGTLNFAYNFPYFCVSIGVLQHNEPVIGVVFNPTTQELYCGLKGSRSECIDLRDGRKKLLDTAFGKQALEDAIVMTHLSTQSWPRRKTIGVLDGLMERCRNVRMLGSGQMSLVSIALGQFDIFFNYSTNIWDIVPGAVILKGAGGYLTSSLERDGDWDPQSKGVLAACNAEIGRQAREYLRAALDGDFSRL